MITTVRFAALLAAALAGCAFEAPSEVLGQCTWRYADTIYAERETPVGKCVQVEVSELERVSAEPIDPCEAPARGVRVIVVGPKDPVYRYYQPITAVANDGEAVVRWVSCPAGTP